MRISRSPKLQAHRARLNAQVVEKKMRSYDYGYAWGFMTEICSSGVLLGNFPQTTRRFLLGKIPRLPDLTGQGPSISQSYRARFNSFRMVWADDLRPWGHIEQSSTSLVRYRRGT